MPPSLPHEGLIALFRNRPMLAPELLRDLLHIALPAYTDVRIESAELTSILPTEYRADLVVLLVDGKPVLGIIVEVQLSEDADKRVSWPAYIVNLFARIRCPVELLVVSPSSSVAAWASTPIQIGAFTRRLRLHHTTVQRVLRQTGVDLKSIAPRPGRGAPSRCLRRHPRRPPHPPRRGLHRIPAVSPLSRHRSTRFCHSSALVFVVTVVLLERLLTRAGASRQERG